MNNVTPIVVETYIFAPIEKIWKYWTEPEHIMQWNNASEDWYTPASTNDLRVGGTFSSTMSARDGSISFDFGGTYTTVRQFEEIAYTLGDNRKVIVEFIKHEDGYIVRETFDPEQENTAELQKSGWQAILENFKKYVDEH